MKKYLFFLLFTGSLVHWFNRSVYANKVIVDNFHWQTSETAHFQIYHYEKSNNILPLVAYHLEKGYKKVVSDFDFEPNERTPFFLYLTHNQFEQTNIVDIDEGTSGVAEALKNRFIVPHTGSEKELEHLLTHEFTHILTFNILCSPGFWKTYRLLKLYVYPLWLTEGIAEYEGGENDATTREMYLRDATLNKQLIPLLQLHNFSHLKPHQVVLAYKEGESVLRFIAEEYGEEKVPDLFYDFLDKLEISSVLMSTIGLDLLTLDRKWQEYLEDKYTFQTVDRKEPGFYGVKLTTRPASGNLYDFNTNAVWSPDGEKIAFLSDRNGETELYLMNRDGEKLNRIVGIENRREIDLIQRNYTLYRAGNDLSYSPDGRWIAFIGEKNERDYLFLYDWKRKKLKKINLLTLGDLDTISQPSFSPDGKKIVFIGMKGGINDLYLYEREEKKITQLTADPNDDRAPSFSADGKWIVFSQEKDREYNLCLMNSETKEVSLLTTMSGDEIMPSFSKDGEKIVFVSDKDGIYNLYLLELETGVEQPEAKEIRQITEIKGGIFTPQFSPDGKEILFTAFSKGEMNIYRARIENFSLTQEMNLSETLPLAPVPPGENKFFLSKSYPYRTRFSTDLFFVPFPAFVFEGGYTAGYMYGAWQGSDYLGNHQLNADFVYAEPGTIFEYQLDYAYRRWRPQLGISRYSYSETLDDGVRGQLNDTIFQLSYPLDRFNQIQGVAELLSVQKKDKAKLGDDIDVEFTVKKNLNSATIRYLRETVVGKYLEPLRGSIFFLSYTASGASFGSDYQFNIWYLYWQKFFPLIGLKSRHHSFALRTLFTKIAGRDRDMLVAKCFLRGYDDDLKGENISLVTVEFNFPIFSDINYDFYFFMPDLFFKYLGGVIFTDVGYAWQKTQEIENLKIKDLKNSVGLGLRLKLFIIQTYPLTIGLDWAKPTNQRGGRWNFLANYTFYLDFAFGVKRGLPRTRLR